MHAINTVHTDSRQRLVSTSEAQAIANTVDSFAACGCQYTAPPKCARFALAPIHVAISLLVVHCLLFRRRRRKRSNPHCKNRRSSSCRRTREPSWPQNTHTLQNRRSRSCRRKGRAKQAPQNAPQGISSTPQRSRGVQRPGSLRLTSQRVHVRTKLRHTSRSINQKWKKKLKKQEKIPQNAAKTRRSNSQASLRNPDTRE